MTLAERLQSTGISLDEKVGFIVEECDHFGQWQAITTGVGRLCLEIPQTVRNLEAMRDFDPHCQVALLVETDIAVSLYVFTPGDDALLCTLEGGGAMIDDDDSG